MVFKCQLRSPEIRAKVGFPHYFFIKNNNHGYKNWENSECKGRKKDKIIAKFFLLLL